MFKNSFGYLVKEGLHNIRANRQMSVASIGVLIACMVLIGGALLLSLNINSLMGYVESFNEVVVWIDDDLGSAGTERLKAEIDDLPNIASKQYISKEDALKELSDTLGSQSFLEGFEQYADENPLPASFRLKVNSLENLPETVKTLESLSGVESVESSNEVATTLVGIKTAIHVAGLTIVAILMVVSIIIIANTVRVTIFNRRREINIMKYVGATNAFIRFPFLVEGMVIGLISALIAFGLLWCGHPLPVSVGGAIGQRLAAAGLPEPHSLCFHRPADAAGLCGGGGAVRYGGQLYLRRQISQSMMQENALFTHTM